MKTLKWLGWMIYYWSTLYPMRSKDLGGYLQYAIRTMPPWRKFTPSVYRNEDGKSWEIWLENDNSYSEIRTIKCDAAISRDGGRIVGLTLFDEELELK